MGLSRSWRGLLILRFAAACIDTGVRRDPVAGRRSAVSLPGSPLEAVTAMAAGLRRACALRLDETVWCWGDNRFGQLGNGGTAASSTPVAVSGLTNVTDVGLSGGDHSCAVRGDGTVWCWGDNRFGQLGNA